MYNPYRKYTAFDDIYDSIFDNNNQYVAVNDNSPIQSPRSNIMIKKESMFTQMKINDSIGNKYVYNAQPMAQVDSLCFNPPLMSKEVSIATPIQIKQSQPAKVNASTQVDAGIQTCPQIEAKSEFSDVFRGGPWGQAAQQPVQPLMIPYNF